MDFNTTEASEDLGGLVRTITESVCTPEHQKELDDLEQRFDSALWRKLIDADILSAAAPESLGGGGFGLLEQVAVLVALIQMGGLLEIRPGSAAIAFGLMVIVTMLAAESFDPRLIWDQEEAGDG